MEKTDQQKVDELIAEIGAIPFVAAVKGHIHPDASGGCNKGYYLNSQGVCVLDLG